ncbi:MAG: cell division protein FtsH [Candidatus Omnitrophica bacterium CG07_land_8_20_14_0_80_42_15]|uniref:ATP-dependent zinc metalloprotease FtsH n=1 Tax=Candidatus Aquitaenariimonas noxiae TaxID=1974741 RepID=A0A2J0KUS4_9BACT|nr:MAG: cell division protein FtsH [Candidatus Omnitrophica bacterium CG07_land_8_20_14_0_80_42_15]
MTLGIFYILHVASMGVEKPPAELTYGNFYSILKDNPKTGRIESAVQVENVLKGKFKDGEKFIVYVPENDQEVMKLLRDNISNFDIKPIRTMWANIFYSLGPMVLFIAFLYFFIYRGAAQGGSKILAFGKSKAKQVAGGQTKITFNDVAGVDEAKEELTEIIEFLKDPKKFQRLGGKIPKGVLLMGPPGTGKTLLAKAVSGEAEVPFFSLSGSDFVEMFVGVGASRVRDLFEQAKRSAKQSQKGCIIFIDEIDAVGRQRFAGIGGGHDEREQTLNALLVEMDGFDTHAGVILIAATNRPDVLDPALLRPGRFDRQIVIDRPDLVGREQILKVHVRSIKVDKDVDLNAIARQTPGFSGADLANLANEAALLAARRDKDAVTMPELQESIERVMTGPERKSRVISKKEKSMVAYHESGHALLSLLIPGVDPLHKVSIIPRGTSALGYTMQLPLEDRYITTKTELISRLIILLGGRVSEELIFNEISTGAHNDLEVSTDIARKMVTKFGMSEKLGSLTYGKRDEQIFLGRDLFEERNYSEETARLIDQEVKSMVDYCYKIAKDKLTEHKEELKKLAEVLLEKEVLDSEEVKKIVGIKNADPKQEEPGTKKA